MTTLTGRSPKDSYMELLKINHLNAGLDTTLRGIEDGLGVATSLQLSTTDVSTNGLKWPSGGTAGQMLRVSTTSGLLEWAPAIGSIASQSASSVAITGGTITGLGLPVASSDAATKAYVDAVASSGSTGFATGMELYSVVNPGAGWLPANGAMYAKASYPALATAIGNPTNSNWIQSAATIGANGYSMNSIAYANGFFYTCAAVSNSSAALVQYSTSGSIFTTLPSSPFTGPNLLVAYGAGKWVAIDYNSFPFTSVNGTTFTPQSQFITGAGVVNALIYANGMFVATCSAGRIATSTDGINWSVVQTPASSAIYNVAYGNGIFMAAYGHATVLISSDGVTWTSKSTTGNTNYLTTGVAYANGKFITMDSSSAVQVTSNNGTSWTTVAAVSTSGINIMASGGIFLMVVVGASNGSPAFYFSSTGVGGSWVAYSVTMAHLFCMTFSAGTLIMGGDNGTTTYAAYAKPYTYNPDVNFIIPSLTSYIPALPYIKT